MAKEAPVYHSYMGKFIKFLIRMVFSFDEVPCHPGELGWLPDRDRQEVQASAAHTHLRVADEAERPGEHLPAVLEPAADERRRVSIFPLVQVNGLWSMDEWNVK